MAQIKAGNLCVKLCVCVCVYTHIHTHFWCSLRNVDELTSSFHLTIQRPKVITFKNGAICKDSTFWKESVCVYRAILYMCGNTHHLPRLKFVCYDFVALNLTN